MFTGIVMTHSTTGGTGSGLGSRLLENLYDAYPTQFRLTASLLPSLCAGDSSLQSYNSVLTLARLQEFADGIMWWDNDALMASALGQPCPRLAPPVLYDAAQQGPDATTPPATSGGVPAGPSFADATQASASSSSNDGGAKRVQVAQLNDQVADALFGVLAPWTVSSYHSVVRPAGSTAAPSTIFRPFQAFDLVDAACPLPAYKFMEVYTVSGISGLVGKPLDLSRQLKTTMPAYDLYAQPCRSLFRVLLARGYGGSGVHSGTEAATAAWLHELEATLSPTSLDLCPAMAVQAPAQTAGCKRGAVAPGTKAVGQAASLTACVNRTRISACLEHLLVRARNMFSARAFLHWYLRHGCEELDFLEAFDTVQSIIDSYNTSSP